MRISTFYDHIVSASKKEGTTTEKMLERVKELGFSGIELDYFYFDNGFAKMLKPSGMATSNVYIFCEKNNIDSKSEKERFLYDVATLGSRKVMIIPKMLKNRTIEKTCEDLNEFCDISKSFGIKVTIENFDYFDSPCCGVENLRYILDRVSDLGFTFDTGNFVYCGQDAVAAFGKLKDRLSHCHIKDRRITPLFDGDKGCVTLDAKTVYPSYPGEGILCIDECLADVKSAGYDDYIAIEHFGTEEQWKYMCQDAKWAFEKANTCR